MSVTAAMQSAFRPCQLIAEDSYCAPWDLKIQEEKFQRAAAFSTASLGSSPPAQSRTVPPSLTTKKFSSESPPVVPPLPPGGLLPAPNVCGIASRNRTVSNYLMMEHADSSRMKMPSSVKSQSNQSDGKMLHSFVCGSLPASQCRGRNQTLTREIDLLANTDDSEPMSFQVCFVSDR